MDDAFQEFISDPRLRRVMERLQRSNNIFDMIRMDENQHSDLLKWLFDPREGHGQGDAIFKDFLTAAYWESEGNVLCNKDFFCEWTPSRIARTGFHSLIAMREHAIPEAGRLDLLMVDPVNEIIVVVENKYGAQLGPNQLERYYQGVAELRARPAFKRYRTVHIVLDKHYGGEEDAETYKSPRNRWSFLDYRWLEAGAERAGFQSSRGNDSAGLVIAYCQKQTDYVPPGQKEVDDLLADIFTDYGAVVASLREAMQIGITSITDGQLSGDVGEKWIFTQQYPELVKRLLSKARLTFIEREFKTSMHDRHFETEFGKRDFGLVNEKWCAFMEDANNCWAVYIWALEDAASPDTPSTYSIGVTYRQYEVSDEYGERVHAALSAEFPELTKWTQCAARRILGRKGDLTAANVASKAKALYLRVEHALNQALLHAA